MGDREEILVNFQAITGMEDIAVCLDILEQKNWDLMAAVGGVMPQQDFSSSTSNGPAISSSHSSSTNFVDLTSDSNSEAFSAQEMRHSEQVCNLGVYFGEKLLTLTLPLDSTLAQVKRHLELSTSVPPSEQVLSGWPEAMQVPKELEDQMTLAELNISGDIYHIRMDHQVPSHYPSLPNPQGLSGALLSEHNHMNKPPSLSVLYAGGNHIIDSPVQETAYSDIRSMSVDPGSLEDPLSSPGSPEGLKKEGEFSGGMDELVVGSGSSISRRARVVSPSGNSADVAEVVVIPDDSGDSSGVPEEFNVDDDDLFDDKDEKMLKALKDPLVPQDCTEPYEVLQCFTHSFEMRYGPIHPFFLLGSLADVVAEATSASPSSRTRKPMFVYLHHDGSVLSNVFCSQLLCKESIVNYLSLNYSVWAWDLTLHVHRLKLLSMVEDCFGSSAKTSVDGIRADHLPVILLAYKEKGTVGIKNIVQGETNPDALMTSLIVTVDEHNAVIEREIQEERERMARGNMIAEQNRAYEESLQADREKARKKKELEEEEEMERQSKEVERAAMGECVPEEPADDCEEKMCTLKIRFPGGEVEQRRFLAVNTLQDVVNFLGSKSFMVSQYKVLTSFPRKDLTEQNFQLSLDELKLCPQETVFVEERT